MKTADLIPEADFPAVCNDSGSLCHGSIHARQPIITSTALVFYKSELLNPDSPVAYCRDAGFRAHFMFCILYDMKITIDKEVIYISKGSHLFSTSLGLTRWVFDEVSLTGRKKRYVVHSTISYESSSSSLSSPCEPSSCIFRSASVMSSTSSQTSRLT